MKYLLALLLAASSLPVDAGELPDVEQRKIDYLISAIETLAGAEFIRNGKAYDAKAAADHLRLKLRRAGSRIATAEDFIRYCASGSSVSGKPYEIRFADGTTLTTERYLSDKLAHYREST